ncbi:hypothetical protein D3C78_820290 [compost metagenome]
MLRVVGRTLVAVAGPAQGQAYRLADHPAQVRLAAAGVADLLVAGVQAPGDHLVGAAFFIAIGAPAHVHFHPQDATLVAHEQRPEPGTGLFQTVEEILGCQPIRRLAQRQPGLGQGQARVDQLQ